MGLAVLLVGGAALAWFGVPAQRRDLTARPAPYALLHVRAPGGGDDPGLVTVVCEGVRPRRAEVRGSRLVVLGVLLLVGCAGEPGAADEDDNTGGMGVPQQFPSETFPGDRGTVTTRVHLASNGCFLGSTPDTGDRRRLLIVWPTGTEQGSSGDTLRLPDGTAVRDRDLLTGDGLVMATRALEGFGSEGYWDLAVGFCTPDASDVLVLDSAVPR